MRHKALARVADATGEVSAAGLTAFGSFTFFSFLGLVSAFETAVDLAFVSFFGAMVPVRRATSWYSKSGAVRNARTAQSCFKARDEAVGDAAVARKPGRRVPLAQQR